VSNVDFALFHTTYPRWLLFESACVSSLIVSAIVVAMVAYVRVGRRFQNRGEARWPRELNPLQLHKTHSNRKSTSKLRKHLHQFDSTRAANTRNTNKYRNELQIFNTNKITPTKRKLTFFLFFFLRIDYHFYKHSCTNTMVTLWLE